jgi:hypothetical protein
VGVDPPHPGEVTPRGAVRSNAGTSTVYKKKLEVVPGVPKR